MLIKTTCGTYRIPGRVYRMPPALLPGCPDLMLGSPESAGIPRNACKDLRRQYPHVAYDSLGDRKHDLSRSMRKRYMQQDVRCPLARVNRPINTSSNTHLIDEISKGHMQHGRMH